MIPPGLRPPGERYLLPTERHVVAVRRHPALLLRPVAETVLALVLVGVLTGWLPAGSLLVDVAWWCLLAMVARLGWRVVEWGADRFVVTDQRILLVTGLLTRRVAMMPLRKVTDMTYERSVAGRLLGYGEFIMESAGQDQALRRVSHLPSPDRLYLQVSELLFGARPVLPRSSTTIRDRSAGYAAMRGPEGRHGRP